MMGRVLARYAPAAVRQLPGGDMAKSKGSSVYRVTELVGTSRTSWEDAARSAVKTASRTLRDLRVAEVTKTDLVIEGGKVVAFRARVSLSFKYDG
jgi:flavin-binding protein dodecin